MQYHTRQVHKINIKSKANKSTNNFTLTFQKLYYQKNVQFKTYITLHLFKRENTTLCITFEKEKSYANSIVLLLSTLHSLTFIHPNDCQNIFCSNSKCKSNTYSMILKINGLNGLVLDIVYLSIQDHRQIY